MRLAGRSRRFVASDFARFDFVVAMDRSNLEDLFDLAPDAAAEGKLSLLRDHDPSGARGLDVPDPYYGGDQGFDEVLDICARSCRGLLALVRARLDL
jgi:protein-tyrosine phosphatase